MTLPYSTSYLGISLTILRRVSIHFNNKLKPNYIILCSIRLLDHSNPIKWCDINEDSYKTLNYDRIVCKLNNEIVKSEIESKQLIEVQQ